MFSRKSISAAIGALVLGFSVTVSGHDSATLRQTNYLTFSRPVQLPGISLLEGTYVFERLEPSTPDVVVVRSRDRSKVYFMAMTQRVTRPSALRADVAITFGEALPGRPVPITAWYPMGESVGHQFIYRTP